MKDKIPFYETVNMFFTGTVFSIVLFLLLYKNISISEQVKELLEYCEKWSVIVGGAVLVSMYEIGFILNKIGAVTLGYILPKANIWPRGKYSITVSEIEKKNTNFRTMNIELHVVRTHIIMYLILGIVAAIMNNWIVAISLAVLVVVFVLAGCRINSLMNKIKKDYYVTKKCRHADGSIHHGASHLKLK